MDIISAGDDTLTFKSDENISRAVADNAVLLAGVTVNRTPLNGIRDTNNLAAAAALTDNTLVITISTSVAQGDEWFVKIDAGLVQDAAGNTNTAAEFSAKLAITNQFLVADLPRSTAALGRTTFVADNYRTFFVTFSIGTGTATEGEYRLGLKAASKPAPTVSELTNANAALTRTLAAEKINIYLPFHIEGTYFDTGVTQDYATARATVLSPATSYTLYITPADGSGTVEKLLDFTTDAVPATVPGTAFYGLPIPFSHKYTVRTNDPFMLIAEFGTLLTDPVIFRLYNNTLTESKMAQCSETCINASPYKGWVSTPAKTYILAYVIQEESLGVSFDDAADVGRINVYLTFQTTP